MQPSELRDDLHRRKTEWRRMLPLLRQQMRDRLARLEQTEPFKSARERLALRVRRRRQRTMAAVALALLALLFLDCEGGRGKPVTLAKAAPIATVKPTPKPATAKPGPLKAKLESQKRPGYTLDARPGPDWLDDFRLQVAARSPRLSECFNGAERGGTLRWTVSIDAKSGAVADHDFEALGSGAQFRSKHAACVARVLSDPGYQLKSPPAEALPNRVSMVLEF